MNLEQYNSWKDAEDFVQAYLKKNKEKIIKTSEGNFLHLEFDTEQTKEQFFENHKDIWYGIIYKVTNIIDDKIYIGQTTQYLYERRHQHLRPSNQSHSHFNYALRKYGEHFFEWEIIDYAKTPEKLDEKEKYWVKFYKTIDQEKGYNLTEGGQGIKNFKFSKESNEKRSQSVKQFHKENFYKEYPVDQILEYLKENHSFYKCTEIFNVSSYKRLKKFISDNFNGLFEECKKFNYIERDKQISKKLMGRKFPEKTIQLPCSFDKTKELLEQHKSFVKVAEILNIKPITLRKRIKEFDENFYNRMVKEVLSIRNGKNGSKSKKGKGKYKYVISNELLIRMKQEKESGTSYKELSQKYNFPDFIINRRLKKLEVNNNE